MVNVMALEKQLIINGASFGRFVEPIDGECPMGKDHNCRQNHNGNEPTQYCKHLDSLEIVNIIGGHIPLNQKRALCSCMYPYTLKDRLTDNIHL